LSDGQSSDAPLPDQMLLHKQRLQQFVQLLEEMPPLRREVFIRRRLHGQTHAEIAEALDLTPDAVEKHIVRGMRQLCEAIDQR
jgi:RNA polymerase sigma-70 factor (ECF subfamily)